MAGTSLAMTRRKISGARAMIGRFFVTGLLVSGITFSASAQTPEEFYKGKTIQLLVGFGPGGEDDVWARTIAKHIGNHIPGNPTMVPVHAPGSGGLLVVNRLYNAAPKDGSVVGMINR